MFDDLESERLSKPKITEEVEIVLPPAGSLAKGLLQVMAAQKNKQSEIIEKREVPALPPRQNQDISHEWEGDDHKSLLDESLHTEDLPMVIEARRKALAKVSPVKDIFVDEAAAANSKSEYRNPKQIQNSKNSELDTGVDSQMLNVKSQERPWMHDVQMPVVPKKRGVGPLDEMGSFSLVDWRRLGPSAQAAGSVLLSKFETLKEESYLIYMDALQSWYNSPLYHEYQSVLAGSLKTGNTVIDILQNKTGGEDLSLDEFKSIVQLNHRLVY